MNNQLSPSPNNKTERIQRNFIEVGQWYWVKDKDHEGAAYEWLGCAMHIGSNFVELLHPKKGNSQGHIRVLFKNMHAVLRPEENASQVIQLKIEASQNKINGYLSEVKDITARLGVGSRAAIEHQESDNSTALSALSSELNVKDYELSLIKAKTEDLPALFKRIKKENAHLAQWMSAEILPLEAASRSYSGVIDEVDNRIFNVSLYSGLTENAHQCSEGQPGDMNDKLHIMQRKLYMDEECLLNYRHGGMEFSDITSFDSWLVEPENRDRILPFSRTIVAMQVRRKKRIEKQVGHYGMR